MPVSLRLLAPALLLIPLASCGSGGEDSVTGIVNDTTRRVCVVDATNGARDRADRVARCFDAAADVVGSVKVGDCVRLSYEDRGNARLPRVTSVGASTACPVPAEPLPAATR